MRRFSTFMIPLTLLSIAGCIDQTSAPDEDDEEVVGEASAALSTSQIGSNTASSFEVPNGKKLVISGGILHAVFRSAGIVRYTSSTDGITWTAPVIVDGTAARDPSIAVASDGTVMIAYVRSPISGAGTIHLVRRSVGGGFSAPFAVTSNTDAASSKTPSLVANGNDFHLSWARTTQVKYAGFPSSQSTSLASAENVHTAFGTAVLQPATMVGPGPSGPIVRVALADSKPLTPSPPGPAFGTLTLVVRERGTSSWSQVYSVSGPFYSAAQLSSVSADTNPTTGDSYVVVSRTLDSVGETILLRENMLTPGNSFAESSILATAPLVSIAARIDGCESRFRILSSTPITGHGAASYRTGTWTSGIAPTWIDASPMSLPGTSRAGTALLGSVSISGTLTSRFFYGTYEDMQASNLFSLRDAYDVGPTPVLCE